MRILLRKLLANIVSEQSKKTLKRIEFKSRKRLSRMGFPLRQEDFLSLFKDEFGLCAGDVVMVHASASMLNTTLLEEEILDVLRKVITSSGTIIVPTFPALSSIKFIKRKSPFNTRTTRSGMGLFSEVLRKSKGAVRSTNPTKSIAALGPLAVEICADHEQCLYPFGVGSPYEKLLAHNVKIIGIGVSMSYLSFVHVAEDLFPELTNMPIWEPTIFEKTCIDMSGKTHSVRTKVHNLALMQRANPGKFCNKHLDSKHYVMTRRWMSDFFMVEGGALTNALVKGLKKGVTIYD